MRNTVKNKLTPKSKSLKGIAEEFMKEKIGPIFSSKNGSIEKASKSSPHIFKKKKFKLAWKTTTSGFLTFQITQGVSGQ